VPVVSRGTVIGGLFFGHREVGRFTESDERIAMGIAAHAAVAVNNARLYDAERRAREHEEKARQRLAIVADAGRCLLSSSLDLDAAMTELAQLVVPRLADGCCIDIEDGGTLRRAAAVIRGEARQDVDEVEAVTFDPEEHPHPAVRALRTGHPELFQSGSAELNRLAGTLGPHGSSSAPEPPTSALVVPLPGRDRILGVMTLVTYRASGRELGPDDLELADVLARRAAIAADQAALYAAQQAAAETLQHSLLPERLPAVPGMEMAARYLPGGAGVEVGGDWYDVITLPGGTVGLAMGDVVGKGVPAASLMGQLRNGLRACARDGRPPAHIVELLNDLLAESDSAGHMATLVFGVFDPATGELTLVNAGHPPPLLRRPDGTVTFVQGSSGIPLGALADSRYTATALTIEPGSTLLLYTDGLVEGRNLPLDEGMERLRACVVNDLDCERLCDEVVARCSAGDSSRDDIALLAVRFVALDDQLHLSLPARPGTLQPLRSVIRRWLREGGASEEEVFDVLVATGEACANAIRHAPATGAAFELDGRRDTDICITVRNRGRWRERFNPGDGGRGLSIMNEFMDDVEITKGPPETVVTMRRTLGHRAASVV
jgi:serine phosphatase RsbU (regulator of sigma subunit)/anti-sigma regulatory factor (Ser/Thr protein kinase)